TDEGVSPARLAATESTAPSPLLPLREKVARPARAETDEGVSPARLAATKSSAPSPFSPRGRRWLGPHGPRRMRGYPAADRKPPLPPRSARHPLPQGERGVPGARSGKIRSFPQGERGAGGAFRENPKS